MAPKYAARIAKSVADLRRVQALRAEVFRGGKSDADSTDLRCTHILIEENGTGRAVCVFRLQAFESGAKIGQSYAATLYDLTRLQSYEGKLLEIGRFCIDPRDQDPDILRLAWAVLAAYVDQNRIGLLFGCSSFSGANPKAHLEAFTRLKARHLAPRRFSPEIKAPEVFRFSRLETMPNESNGQIAQPPLLRSYLSMGAWVSDHAVLDRDLGTMHVFTGLEIAAIPARRKRLLRAAGRALGPLA